MLAEEANQNSSVVEVNSMRQAISVLCAAIWLVAIPVANACSPTAIAPTSGQTISGIFALRVNPGCTLGNGWFIRFYFNQNGHNVTYAQFPGGATTDNFNTTKLPSGNYQSGIIVWDATGLIIEGRGTGPSFTVSNTTPTPYGQCAPQWTRPGTWQSTQANPPVVSGTITLGWQANCPSGKNWNQVRIYAGCPESINPSCAGYTDPWPSYYQRVFNIPENATSMQFDTHQFPINEHYDVNIGLLNNGAFLGSTRNGCTQVRGDCDIVVAVNNGGTSAGGATNCSPVITMPANYAVLSGTATVGAQANCNGEYDHLRWSFGPAGGSRETGYANIAPGSSTATFNTKNFPNGNYQVAAAASSNSGFSEIPHWSPLRYFTIRN